MKDWLLHIIPYGLGLVGLLFIAAVVLALRSFQATRTGGYYFMREEARRQGCRWSLLALAMLVLGLVLALLSPGASQEAPSLTAGYTRLPTLPLPTPAPSPSSSPSPSPLPPPTLPATATGTPPPTPIPRDQLPPPLLTPHASAVAAAPNAYFGPITFAPPGEDGQCPRSLAGAGLGEFPAGTPRICAYFLARNLATNVAWTMAWYRDGIYVDGSTLLWDGPPNDVGKAFYAAPGRQPGQWELRLYIEDRLYSSGLFVVLPAASATPGP